MDSSVNGNSNFRFRVVAVPYPGRGHINPMMNLCKIMANRRPNNFLITFVVTEEWHGILSSEPLHENNIRFATIPNVIPSEIGRAKDFTGFVQAVLNKMEGPVEHLLDQLEQPKPSVIIFDSFLKWGLGVANRRNIPAASLWPMSTTCFSLLRHYESLVENGHLPSNPVEEGDHRVTCIPGVPSIRLADFPRELLLHGTSQTAVRIALEVVALASKAEYLLFSSVYELESRVIDSLKAELPNPIYSIGLAIPSFNVRNRSNNDHIAWLDAQPRSSVLYISQGSFLSASNEQSAEIIAGVHESGIRFFWVDRQDISTFQASGGDTGNGVVVHWCDQLKVLCHPSIGGFWSHCGWNSTKEGAFAGLPMLTFPLAWDQYTNSKQIVEDWKIGRRLKRDDGGLVKREEISRSLKRFMDLECDEGKEMRRRAQEIREICRRATAEGGGSSELEIEAFIENIA
ncbi:UDP-glycosyltransferase 87A1-like [Coffea eugenioides]|uniref:UDP-glycosyltransferase 87A1-like n=1 Tax=Coffea eugenioides TaxID=49369 RepID=UPI000F60AE4E|nr:UDP-glycosyltransferase 87A1-like [Coffea eugenioides]